MFASLAAILAAFRWLEAAQDRDYGTTTIIAALLTLLLGLYAVMGDMTAAAAAAGISAILLASKRARMRSSSASPGRNCGQASSCLP